MKYFIYSIRDVNVGFNQPFLEVNDRVAIRNFSYAVNNSDLPGFAPNDFDLYIVGEFDSEKGTIEAYSLPEIVIHGTEVINRE